MLHKAWNSKGEMPYRFPSSSVQFQGHKVQNITDFDPTWAFPDYRPVAAFKSLRFALLFKKMQLKLSQGNWRPFCFGLNVLIWYVDWHSAGHKSYATMINHFIHALRVRRAMYGQHNIDVVPPEILISPWINGRLFAYDICRRFYVNEKFGILMKKNHWILFLRVQLTITQ